MKRFTLAAVLAWVAIAGGLLLVAWPSPARPDERPVIRVDQFDTQSRRTGYLLIDPKTGRIDTFDTKSQRTGSGQVQPTRPSSSSVVPAPAPRR